jgi:ribonuclease HI
MRVTIISDASHCPNTLVGGYGFWAVSQRGRHAGHGVFKSTMKDATAAETMAIVNALHCSLQLGIAAEGDAVLIQTDCMNAIAQLDGRNTQRKRNDLSKAISLFVEMRDTHSLAINFRHVRGHTKVQDQRSRAQRLSDERAKRAMRKARALKEEQTNA